MADYRYLIVGGGLTGDAAVRGIRSLDSGGTIAMFSQESDPPYTRPWLSKSLWKGLPFEKVWRKTDTLGVDMKLGCAISSLDLNTMTVYDQDGEAYRFEKLLLATGGSPRRLTQDAGRVIYYRTLDDYRKLRDLAAAGNRFAVIGGGFIGSEIAASLAINGKEVMMFFPGEGIGGAIFPANLSIYLNEYYRKNGVEVFAGETVSGVEEQGEKVAVNTSQERQFIVDGVIAGLGISLNTSLAESAGLQVGNGILVDDRLRAGHPEVYAAGDVANFYSPSLGKRIRVEHEDNALVMGELAGRNMAGEDEAYTHLPYFYSDVFDIGYEAAGELSAKLQTFVDWQEPMEKGVIYYLDDGRIRGILLWNIWGQVEAARRLISEPGPFKEDDLRGRLTE